MITKETVDLIQVCVENICKNYDIPAGLQITELMQDRFIDDRLSIFVDIHASSVCNFYEKEVWKNFLKTGVKSKKDYRKLRSLVRIRLIDAIHGLRDLTEESLRNLGAKV